VLLSTPRQFTNGGRGAKALGKGRLKFLREFLRSIYTKFWVLPRIHRSYGTLTLAETFRRVYLTKAWAGSGEPFSSGAGSRGDVAEHYCHFVTKFIEDRGIKSVLDLGCGDFEVGRQIVERTNVVYTGIDIVPELIEHHRSTVKNPRVNFACMDITHDNLPHAELCLVRQVLQHLSNQEIVQVLANVEGYRYVLISEDVPLRPRVFNRDKPHGPDVRSYYGSGIYVDEPPFSMTVSEKWEVPLGARSLLRTVLVASRCKHRQ
jgi:SAM-dependent methyltransferase